MTEVVEALIWDKDKFLICQRSEFAEYKKEGMITMICHPRGQRCG